MLNIINNFYSKHDRNSTGILEKIRNAKTTRSKARKECSSISHLTSYQQELWRELDYLELCAEYSFQGHMNDHKSDSKTNICVGIIATSATTVGTASFLTNFLPTAAAIIALGGAVLTGIMTIMQKSESASKSLSASHGCARVTAKFRQTKKFQVGVIPDHEVRQIIDDLTREYNDANGLAGFITEKSYKKAGESFRTGQRAGRTSEEIGG